jgi:hypothetical protein
MKKSVWDILLFLVLGFPAGDKIEVIRVVTLSVSRNPFQKRVKNDFTKESLTNR